MTSEQLKNSILQFAVQGKLVPQNTNNEPASELLKKIKAEKERLIKEKVIKKEKPSLPITEEERPFELPESWEWVRLGELISLNSGQDLTPNHYTDFNNSGIPYITGASNIKDGQIIINRWTSTPKSIAIKGDILLTCKGTIGKIAILEEPISHIARQIMSIKYFIIPVKYLIAVLETQIESYKQKANSFIPGIDRDTVLNTLFPLPPLVEQQLIVDKIEELMPLVELYGTAESELRKLNTKFPEQLKKSILQYAVQGKLVPQNLNDESVSILLEKIKAERKQLIKQKLIKQDKPLPEIKEDEIPFEIPDSWVWVKLGTICNFGNNGSILSSNISDNSWILELEDIEKETGRILNYITKKDRASVSNKNVFKAGNVLYSKLRPYLNKVVVVENDGYCSSEIFPLDFGNFIYNKYAQLFLMSPFFVDYATTKSYGTKMPRFGTSDGQNVPFPLPPLSEQKLIVEKVEEVLSYCDKLK